MNEKGLVKIASVGSMTEAEQMICVLKENGIMAWRQGSIMDIYIWETPMLVKISWSLKEMKILQKNYWNVSLRFKQK